LLANMGAGVTMMWQGENECDAMARFAPGVANSSPMELSMIAGGTILSSPGLASAIPSN